MSIALKEITDRIQNKNKRLNKQPGYLGKLQRENIGDLIGKNMVHFPYVHALKPTLNRWHKVSKSKP